MPSHRRTHTGGGSRARRVGVAFGAGSAVVLAAVAASASIPSGEGVISGCYAKVGGVLRLVEEGSECRANELTVTWNQQGTPGVPGAPGEPGPAGPAGPASNVSFETSGTFTVPAGVSTVIVNAWGSGGDRPSWGSGGRQGAYIEARLPVSAGDVLSVTVGAPGGDASTVSVGSGAPLVVAPGGHEGGPPYTYTATGSVTASAVGLMSRPGLVGDWVHVLLECGAAGGLPGFVGSGGTCFRGISDAMPGYVLLHLA